MSIRGLEHWLTTPPDEGDEGIAHELGACGGDCPHCQQERMEQRDGRLMEFGDPDYPGEELDVP